MSVNKSVMILITLLQDGPNTILRSETLRQNCVRCHNRKRWCKKPSKRCKTSAMTDASNTVQILVACAMQGIRFSSINFSCVCDAMTKETGSQMKACAIYSIQFTRMNCVIRQHNGNGSTEQDVCDTRHIVHSDEQFVIRKHKRNGQPDEGVCDIRHTVHTDELFALSQENRNNST